MDQVAAPKLPRLWPTQDDTGQPRDGLKVVREEPARLNDLFSGGRYWFRMILNTIPFSIMVTLGFIACIVPGWYLAAVYFPYVAVLVDEDRTGLQSLSRAKELTQGNLGSMFIIVLMTLLGIWLGSWICHLVTLITIPMVSIMNAVAYVRMTYQTPLDQLHNRSTDH